jgi:hypothetical protein
MNSVFLSIMVGLLITLGPYECPGADNDGHPADRVHIIFDLSMDQVASPYTVGFEGLSRFCALLRSHNATVSTNHLPLETFLPRISGKGHVLILGVPWNTNYSPAAINAIHAFLDSGGGVLLISEHDNIYRNADIQNTVTETFGISVLSFHANEKSTTRWGGWPICRSALLDADNICFYWPAPLRVIPPAEELALIKRPANPDHAVVAALNRSRKGAFAVIGDFEVIWNMTAGNGIDYGDNSQFILKLIRLLAGDDRALLPGMATPRIADKWLKGGKTALFYLSGMAMYPDGSPNGLHALADRLNELGYKILVQNGVSGKSKGVDLLISVIPLERMDPPPEARKMLLVADERTDFLGGLPELRNSLRQAINLDGVSTFYPINELAGTNGFIFLPVTVISKKDYHTVSFASLTSKRGSLKLWGSSVIKRDALTGSQVRAVARLDDSYAPTCVITPEATPSDPVDMKRPFLCVPTEERTGSPWPVVVKTKRAMGIADLDLVTDEGLRSESGRLVFEEIKKWLDER